MCVLVLLGLAVSLPTTAGAAATPGDSYFEMSADEGDYLSDQHFDDKERMRGEPQCVWEQATPECQALPVPPPDCDPGVKTDEGCSCTCLPYIHALDVIDPSYHATGRLQHETCLDWVHSGAEPYMGPASYQVQCAENFDPICQTDPIPE